MGTLQADGKKKKKNLNKGVLVKSFALSDLSFGGF